MKKKIAGVTAVLLSLAVLCTGMPVSARSSDDDDEVKVRRVEVNTPSLTVRVNQTRTLWVLITPYDADDQTVYWESSNPEIATVDGDGIVTGISPGTAEVTATSVNGRTGTCVVTVPDHVLSSITTDTEISSSEGAQISGGELLSAATLRVDVEKAVKANRGSQAAVVTYKDKSSVSTAALRGAAYTATSAGGEAVIRIQTSEDSTRQRGDLFTGDTSPIQGWITLSPGLAGEEDRDIGTLVYTTSDKTATAAQSAAKILGGSPVAVRLSHQGSFGMTVSVGARVDLSGLNAGSLHLYYQDAKTGALTPLESQEYSMGTSGYLTFHVTRGGTIIVSDRALAASGS